MPVLPVGAHVYPPLRYSSLVLGLDPEQVKWLGDNYEYSETIRSFLRENENTEEARIASRMAIDAAMLGRLDGPYDTPEYANIFYSNLVGTSYASIQFDDRFISYFILQCAIIKAEHPEYNAFQVYLAASQEMFHIVLDLVGLVPGIGEVADLTNGVIYTIQGDGINATFSYLSAIPIAGWYAQGLKWAKKSITALDGTKRTLNWIRKADNLLSFGDRGLLRKVLGLAPGDARVAHHIIPWDLWDHPAVQKAAQGNDAFHLNELLNGIPLNSLVHTGNHASYISKVRSRLDAIPTTLDSHKTRLKIEELINDIRTEISRFPNTHIDNLNF